MRLGQVVFENPNLSRLSDSGLSREQDDRRKAALGVGPAFHQEIGLAPAPDERREAFERSNGNVETAPSCALRDDLMQDCRLRKAVEVGGTEVNPGEKAVHESVRRIADDDRIGHGRILDARRHVQRVTDGEALAVEPAETVDDDEAGVDADTDLQSYGDRVLLR